MEKTPTFSRMSEERVDSLEDLRPGDHIARKSWFYYHHMLVTANLYDQQERRYKLTVIHYYGRSTSPSGHTLISALNLADLPTVREEEDFPLDPSTEYILKYDHPDCTLTPKERIEKAREKLHENKYSFTKNNCEDFVLKALHDETDGTPASGQVRLLSLDSISKVSMIKSRVFHPDKAVRKDNVCFFSTAQQQSSVLWYTLLGFVRPCNGRVMKQDPVCAKEMASLLFTIICWVVLCPVEADMISFLGIIHFMSFLDYRVIDCAYNEVHQSEGFTSTLITAVSWTLFPLYLSWKLRRQIYQLAVQRTATLDEALLAPLTFLPFALCRLFVVALALVSDTMLQRLSFLKYALPFIYVILFLYYFSKVRSVNRFRQSSLTVHVFIEGLLLLDVWTYGITYFLVKIPWLISVGIFYATWSERFLKREPFEQAPFENNPLFLQRSFKNIMCATIFLILVRNESGLAIPLLLAVYLLHLAGHFPEMSSRFLKKLISSSYFYGLIILAFPFFGASLLSWLISPLLSYIGVPTLSLDDHVIKISFMYLVFIFKSPKRHKLLPCILTLVPVTVGICLGHILLLATITVLFKWSLCSFLLILILLFVIDVDPYLIFLRNLFCYICVHCFSCSVECVHSPCPTNPSLPHLHITILHVPYIQVGFIIHAKLSPSTIQPAREGIRKPNCLNVHTENMRITEIKGTTYICIDLSA